MAERKDVRRNREALIYAARETFFTRGMDAPVKSIAKAAGVGSATLYRHFPTRAALVSAVFSEEIRLCRTKLSEVTHIMNPWEGLRHLLTTVADTEAAMPGLAISLSSARTPLVGYDTMWTEARGAVSLLAQRLRSGGDAREDLTRDDLWLLITTVRSVNITRRAAAQHETSRLVEIMFEGLWKREKLLPRRPATWSTKVR